MESNRTTLPFFQAMKFSESRQAIHPFMTKANFNFDSVKSLLFVDGLSHRRSEAVLIKIGVNIDNSRGPITNCSRLSWHDVIPLVK